MSNLKPVSVEEQRAMGLRRERQLPANYVQPDRVTVLPSHHEVHDPYAMTPALESAQMVSHHHYHPKDRAVAMVMKTSAVTVFLALLTLAALIMLHGWGFFLWLFLASLEWCAVFAFLAILDWRETPAAHVWHKTDIYADLMQREQRARLKSLYGYEED